MSRPKGTSKPPEEKWRGFHVKMPPALLERFHRLVPHHMRSELLRSLLATELARRERLARREGIAPAPEEP
jgi:metal-responsive CopG/Arc/MetJ family transcriptional regulator